MDRIRRFRSLAAVSLPAAVLAVGLFVGPLRSAEWRWRSPILSEVRDLTALDPVRAVPRTEAALALLDAQRDLDAGRPWAAWRAVRGHLDVEGVLGPATNLLAARSAAAWGGWAEVRRALEGRAWLHTAGDAEGLVLLARAHEELGNDASARDAYARYLAQPAGRQRGQAHARLARLHAGAGAHSEAAAAFAAAAADLPEIADWLRVLQVEQLVAAGDHTVQEVATAHSGGSPAVRLRRIQVEARGWVGAGDPDRALRRLEWEARVLNASGARTEAAQLMMDRAELLLAGGQSVTARDLLRSVAGSAAVAPGIRAEAARRLGELDGLGAVEHLARASAFEAAQRPGLAARALRGAFEAGAPDEAESRLRLARLLYAERDFGPARAAFLRAAELSSDREVKADAELHAARSLFRAGGNARTQASQQQQALAAFRGVIDRYPGTAAAGTALFLLGDAAANNQQGIAFYRRAAAIESSPDAREALYRVGDRSLRLRDTAGAIRAWEEYVHRYPRGEQTARVAYDVGKLHESAGRRSPARAMFTAAMSAEPTSYFAVRAGERLGLHPLENVLAEPRPWIGLASEPAEADALLRRLDGLAELGLAAERTAELQAGIRTFEGRPLAMITLAEGLRDRNEPVEAIRLGRSLLPARGGEWDERLLRVVFPLPYRDLILAESARAGVDPMLFAALVRQESSFLPAVKSRVGATGLGQIMPATGRWLAPSIKIHDYDHTLLEVPEVNLRMGTKYLADLLRRYDGEVDLALAGYNAGPGRADRWRRELGHGRDTDAFRQAIPFDETRNYVMIVIRNAAIYQRLWGDAG